MVNVPSFVVWIQHEEGLSGNLYNVGPRNRVLLGQYYASTGHIPEKQGEKKYGKVGRSFLLLVWFKFFFTLFF